MFLTFTFVLLQNQYRDFMNKLSQMESEIGTTKIMITVSIIVLGSDVGLPQIPVENAFPEILL